MATPMEQFMLDNAARHQNLIKALKTKPKPSNATTTTQANPDVIVCARIRPLLDHELAIGSVPGIFPRKGAPNVVDIHELRQMVRGPPTLKSSHFEPDRCFGADTSTQVIYDETLKSAVPWAWDGGITTLFAYGQTGSGKTYTVSQLQRLLAAELMSGELPGTRKIFITIIELAGNAASDLLNSQNPVPILDDSFGVTHIAGAVEREVHSADELLECIDSAATFRRTEATLKNDTSSRSHAVCRIRIADPGESSDEDGLIYLVDLAGSEAARDKAQHDAERMRETRQINTSLSVLKDCIKLRAEADQATESGSRKKKKPYVPFRQSTLTRVLKHIFDPAGTRRCRTIVIACVNPSLLDLAAGRNTLRYAETLRVLLPKSASIEYDPASPMTWTNSQLRAWIQKNSGNPAIDGSLVAPIETGTQFLRLPAAEIEARCLKTTGVTSQQAHAFHSKLWILHVESQAGGNKTSEQPSTVERKPGSSLETSHKMSSRPDDPELAKIPFKERIRPGMVVSWSRSTGTEQSASSTSNLAYILCPVAAAGPHAMTAEDSRVNSSGPLGVEESSTTAYICATVKPSFLHESYEVQLWHHVVVSLDQMDAEVLLEFDPGTRYYFVTL
ncbi:kinesin motor domain-containing protein [Sarocladium implicatum]|nr:kinesin motor domain-containing protein [Sarocladium implicatum]